MPSNDHAHATATSPQSLKLGWGSPLDAAPDHDEETDSADTPPALPWLQEGSSAHGGVRRPTAVPDRPDVTSEGGGASRAAAQSTGPQAARAWVDVASTRDPVRPSVAVGSESTPDLLDPVDGPALSNAVRSRQIAPREGWRAVAYRLSGGRWHPGLSEAETRKISQLQRIRTPLPGPHSVVVGSMKGGVGKTTVASLLGLSLAEHRGDRVVAIDANPDAGTLGDRLVGEAVASRVTLRNLLTELDKIRSFTDVSRYAHLADRLQVLTSEQEPESSEAFSQRDYETVLRLLSQYCQAIITDSGTGITHSAMQGGLLHCDSLVIVGTLTQDGASRASKTLNWLAERQWSQISRDAVVVLSRDRHSPDIDEEVIRNHFRARCRAVIELPADPHLSTGGLIDLEALHPATRDAALEIAATVADGFHGRRTHGLASHGFR